MRWESAKRRGLIPAYAGSTHLAAEARSTYRAHPRLRGEHSSEGPVGYPVSGSSPLTRGALLIGWKPAARLGLIPAYAGSTGNHHRATGGIPAHPRLRGEHDRDKSVGDSTPGSSPLTRGAPVSSWISSAVPGLIPAYAGSTRSLMGVEIPIGAHPRLRGEHHSSSPRANVSRGSSPLTRGAHQKCWCDEGADGLIPAYAGSTMPPPPQRRSSPAHPRLRGEHFMRVRR